MLGEETAPIPVPWGGILVLGVLACALVALGGEKASSPRTRRMRANGRRPARKQLLEPATLIVREDGRVVLAQAADWADGAMHYSAYPSMEAFRDEWDVRTAATEAPQPAGVGYTARFPDAVKLLRLSTHKGKMRKNGRSMSVADAREAGARAGKKAASRFAQPYHTVTGNESAVDRCAERAGKAGESAAVDKGTKVELSLAAFEAYRDAYAAELFDAAYDVMRDPSAPNDWREGYDE